MSKPNSGRVKYRPASSERGRRDLVRLFSAAELEKSRKALPKNQHDKKVPEQKIVPATPDRSTDHKIAESIGSNRTYDLWLACWTNQEIADDVGMTPQGVGEVLKESATLPKVSKPAAEHATDFDVPIYNIWKQQTKSEGSSHFGNSETRSGAIVFGVKGCLHYKHPWIHDVLIRTSCVRDAGFRLNRASRSSLRVSPRDACEMLALPTTEIKR